MLQLCVDGKVKLKKRAEVGEGFPLVGRDTGPGKGEGSTGKFKSLSIKQEK